MKSPLLIVLGISSTLLGLYILVISLMNIQEKADYHIGCYLSNYPNDHAFQFRTRLEQLRAKGDESRNFHRKIRDSQLVDPQLNKKSVLLTKNVESYIQKLALVKKYQQGNMEFFVQLSNARQAYENCANEIRTGVDIEDSKQLWGKYKQCFDRYQLINDNIDSLYSKRNKYLAEIDQLLLYDPNANRTFDLEEELKKIKQRYDRDNALNDKNKENYISELKRLQHRNQSKSSEYDENQREFNKSKLSYDICLKNLKEFRKCEDINKALQGYGYVDSFESLQERIKLKRQMLAKLQMLVLQSRQQGGENKVITQMCDKRQRQLIQIIKLRLDMGWDEMKECGCTEEQRSKLEADFENAKIKLNLNKQELNELTYEIFSLEKKIKETDRQRERMINEFREETERLRNRQTSNIVTLQQSLAIVKANLAEVNEQLNNFSPKLNSLEFQCNQFKDRLALKLKDSDTVTDCFGKKDFYDQLKSKAELILRKDDVSTLEGKQRITDTLRDISYPAQIGYIPAFQSQKAFETPEKLQTLSQVKQELGQFQEEANVDEQRVKEQESKQPAREVIIITREEKVTIQTREL